ncbi:hypothetical protein COU57_03920 [Candidatus Pacearchaeota archaeon CG10_big_fil_rev_8_21_14_0_10_32_14]|nr:MAG: hypothetical protein COU57_03920 [Candidatus Pacearchaeota archaeon CG10_big_fil_rev_8_21_14_0_10_32_14]
MRIDILHHDLEPTEKALRELLDEKGIGGKLVDVRDVRLNDFSMTDLVLNRVYASVGNRDYASITRTLELLKELEEGGIPCLNSYETSVFDYNKWDSYNVMKSEGISTPETMFVNSKNGLDDFCKTVLFEFPVIVKRNTGGRGKDISKVDSYLQLIQDLEAKFNLADRERYEGGFVVQEFIRSNRNHDCRIGIVNGEFAFSFKRSLISLRDGDEPWLASVSMGSDFGFYEVSQDEINLALRASRSIGAKFNEIDMMFEKEGPCIIEHNPTPQYILSDLEEQKRIKTFVDTTTAYLLEGDKKLYDKTKTPVDK